MADDSIHIEYNEDLHALEALLSDVTRDGEFFVSGTCEVPMPKVVVEGVGALSIPVPPTQIEALIRLATRAPYGRGEETILDETVRKVWQLAPEKVQVGGKSWPGSFAGILQQVATGLGCEGVAVSAELYKLLVYDAGGFFLAHRDTEKADGMFGTLVLTLPSEHEGGELLIRHAGREVTVDLSHAEFSELAFAAFYADCEHEVRPIRRGNRVCLVYNLMQVRGPESAGKSITAPGYDGQASAAAALLREAFDAPESPAKIAWLLEHQYSPDGLSFSGLKSADAARAKVLSEAAQLAGLVTHVCLVHIEESGAAQEEYDGYRGRRRYHEDEETDFEVIEVSDSNHYLDQWRDVHNQPAGFGVLPLAPGELLPAGALDDEEPDVKRFMEASGNEGASFERSYLRAALVVWPRDGSADVLLQAGPTAAVPYLRELVDAAGAPSADTEARASALAVARKIVEAWQDASPYSAIRQAGGKRHEFLQLLIRLGEVALLQDFIRDVVTPDYDGSENHALVDAARLLPAGALGSLYAGLIRPNMGQLYAPCLVLLHALSAAASGLLANREGRSALKKIAASAVEEFVEAGRAEAGRGWVDPQKRARAFDAELLRKLFEVLRVLDATDLRAAAVRHLTARADFFDPVSVLVPALPLLPPAESAAPALWKHSAQFILQRSEHPPEAPRDWHQEAKLSCTCADCRELQAFVSDPVEQVHRFRMREDRRRHLEQKIGSHALDMVHQTDEKGSPKTLVCTKSRRIYRNRCEQYRQDVQALQTLAEQAARFEVPSETLARIRAACERRAAWKPS